MTKRDALAISIVGFLTVLGATCAYADDDIDARATFSWMLPKTVLDLGATYVFKDCKGTETGIELQLDVKAMATARSVPDLDIGKAFPGGRVSVEISDLVSWRKSTTVSVKLYPGGTLQSLGSKPADQTGPIMANVLTAATKLAALLVGVPTADSTPTCGAALEIKKRIDELKTDLLSPALTPERQAIITSQIATLTDQITVKKAKTVDPGAEGPVDKSKAIAELMPSQEEAVRTKWFNGSFPSDRYKVSFFIAIPEPGPRTRMEMTKGSLYRVPVHLAVEAYKSSEKEPNKMDKIAQQTFAFPQFGTAQRLPLEAGFFESFDWVVNFAQDGSVNDAAFTTAAKGLPASALFSNAASAAGSIGAAMQKGEAADSETAKLKAENEALQAQIQNITLQKQLKALQAAEGTQ